MKLKTRIQLFTTIFLLLLVAIVNTTIYTMFDKMSTTRALDQLVNQTAAIEEALQKNKVSQIPTVDLMTAYIPADGMIRIVAPDGQYVHQLMKDSAYMTLPSEYVTSEKRYIDRYTDGEKVAIIAKPIIWEDGRVVTLQISHVLTSLQSDMLLLLYVLLFSSLFIILPTLLASGTLANFILKPIQQLIETMRRNTEGEKWEKIPLQQNRPHDELYELEYAFNEWMDALKVSFEKQEAFVSDASHELKTPLAIMQGYVQLIERRGKQHPEVVEESLHTIQTELNRMQALIEQLLLLAKNESTLVKETIDGKKLCENVIDSFQGVTDRSFQTKLQPVSFYAHKEQMQQVLYILIDNALAYGEGTITLSLYEREDEIVFIVKDEGHSIEEQHLPHLFDRFYRIDEARTRKDGGTGLGLAIARTIVEAHEGKIVCTKKVDGTQFEIYLPRLS